MKIGILTLHSQLNYGGVLQCWALQIALERMGHEVVVLDRWLDRKNAHLTRGYNQLGILGWIKLIFRSVLGLGDWGIMIRSKKTQDFY